MTKEAAELKRFQKDLERCTKCGFCAYWCPVYQEERTESSLARGKSMIARSLAAGTVDYTPELAERMNKCLLCKTCTVNCPVKTEIPNVIVAARADKVKAKGVKFPYNIIYRSILPRRRLFGNILKVVSGCQGVLFPKSQGTIRHLPLFLSALGKRRHIPSIASKFLRESVPEVNKPPEGVLTKMRVGYFSGCMTEYVFPQTGKKIIDFLTKNGVEVVVPRSQGCCGAPVYLGAGDFETGRRFADANVKAFAGVDYVISGCASCVSSMKDYIKFLADTPERKEAYARFAEKLYDVSSFMVDMLKLPASAYKVAPEYKGKKITWHDPCHMSRHLGVTGQPRQILKSIPGVEYVEMPNADRCCGMAGTFSIYYYELSKKIARKKMEGIEATGADVVVTACPGCQIQLMDNITQNKMPQKVNHLIDLLE